MVLWFQKFESEIQSIAPSSPAEIREKILARQKSRRENQQHGETKHEANSTETSKSEPDPVIAERKVNAWPSGKLCIYCTLFVSFILIDWVSLRFYLFTLDSAIKWWLGWFVFFSLNQINICFIQWKEIHVVLDWNENHTGAIYMHACKYYEIQ